MTESSEAVRHPTTTRPIPPLETAASKTGAVSWAAHSTRDETADLLVRQLANLYEGTRAFRHVVRLGDAAVPALEHFVRGPSQSIHQARSLGLDALAAIASPLAVQSLTRALRDSIARDPDPASLEAESVLVNHIAEHLSRFCSPDVTDALLAALQRRPYPYCAATLGLIGDRRAIPLLVNCLFDDAARPAAAGALQRFGDAALPSLTRVVAFERNATGCSEAPTHVLARAAAISLIGKLATPGSPQALNVLGRALDDQETAVRWEGALALVPSPGAYASRVLEALIAALADPDWGRVQAAADALMKLPGAETQIIRLINVRSRTDEDRRRRLRAVGLAGKMRLSQAVPGLRALSSAADAALRLAAVSALGHIESATAESIARFLTDRQPIIRQRALQALRRQHALTPESATAFLGDEDADVRKLADDSLCDDLDTAWPALQRAALHFGAPLNGFSSRLRLWRHACALLLGRRNRRRPQALHSEGTRR
jgi:HEAT repeat protein